MKEKLLITGASGFLGYHLVEQALSQDFEVYAGVRSSSNSSHLTTTGAHLMQLNLANIDETKRSLAETGITHIIHAAGVTRAKTAADYNFANATLTRNLANAARNLPEGIKKFVFVSSLAAMGPASNNQPILENDPPQPLTSYGKSKLLAEQYLLEMDGLPLVGLRPTAVYGPREKDLFLLVKTVQKGMEVYIGNTEQKLSFVYVKDLAKLAVTVLRSKISGEFYNISDGNVYSRYAFADAAKQALGQKTFRIQLPLGLIKMVAAGMDSLYSRSSKTPVLNKEKLKELTATDWTCSIAKSQRDLQFLPLYNLEKGMLETVEWYKKQNWL